VSIGRELPHNQKWAAEQEFSGQNSPSRKEFASPKFTGLANHPKQVEKKPRIAKR
jgi:hypothetical protein